MINLSNPVTVNGEREAVFAAVVLLGRGMYGAESPDDIARLPILAIGGDPDAFWRAQFGRTLGEAIPSLLPDIRRVLESARLGRPGDVPGMELRRSSLNDIVSAAHSLAKRMEGTDHA